MSVLPIGSGSHADGLGQVYALQRRAAGASVGEATGGRESDRAGARGTERVPGVEEGEATGSPQESEISCHENVPTSIGHPG